MGKTSFRLTVLTNVPKNNTVLPSDHHRIFVLNLRSYTLQVRQFSLNQPGPRTLLPPILLSLNHIPQRLFSHAVLLIPRALIQIHPAAFRNFERSLVLPSEHFRFEQQKFESE